jgi:hypothetical protein
MILRPKRVIVWGHKLHTHTHSYIHSSYYKAFKSLGFETHWLDSSDSIGSSDLSGTLFFSEDQAKTGMPVRSDCLYVTHHFDPSFLKEIPSSQVLKLCNYTKDVESHEKVASLSFYDGKDRSLYQAWATDLLPDEFDRFSFVPFDMRKDKFFYIGSIYDENIGFVRTFAEVSQIQGVQVQHVRLVSDEQNAVLTRESLIAADFRGKHHINVGYIPCRVFKSISYGVPITVNSLHIAESLNLSAIHCEADPTRTLLGGVAHRAGLGSDEFESSRNVIRKEHTFINRVNNILRVLGES